MLTYISRGPEPITLAEAKTQTRVDSSAGTVEDGLFAIWIEAARQWAEDYTGRVLCGAVVEEPICGFPACRCIVPALVPVREVEWVKYYDVDNVLQEFPAESYVADGGIIQLRTGAQWPETTADRKNTVVLRYAAGPAATDTPDARVKQAILLMVTDFYDRRADAVNEADATRVKTTAERLLQGLRELG